MVLCFFVVWFLVFWGEGGGAVLGCAHACAVVRVCVREEVRGARLSSTRMATLKVIKLRRALQPPLTPDTALPIPPTPQNIAIINIPPPKKNPPTTHPPHPHPHTTHTCALSESTVELIHSRASALACSRGSRRSACPKAALENAFIFASFSNALKRSISRSTARRASVSADLSLTSAPEILLVLFCFLLFCVCVCCCWVFVLFGFSFCLGVLRCVMMMMVRVLGCASLVLCYGLGVLAHVAASGRGPSRRRAVARASGSRQHARALKECAHHVLSWSRRRCSFLISFLRSASSFSFWLLLSMSCTFCFWFVCACARAVREAAASAAASAVRCGASLGRHGGVGKHHGV